ncbi:phosphoadenosine phosphosulfate reductase, partial [Pseudomonas syringae pv. pisi str. 1704B]
SAWATGQRRDQSPGTRSAVAAVEIDSAFSTAERTLYKFNPLAQMSSEEIWGYIRMLELPYNSLHERGFISIGCEPCTRRYCRTSTSARVAGGGKKPRRRNADCMRAI